MATRANNKKTGKATPKVTIQRPSWNDVYQNYPKVVGENKDMPAPEVFKKLFGSEFNTDTQKLTIINRDKTTTEISLNNACATRVSVALNLSQNPIKTMIDFSANQQATFVSQQKSTITMKGKGIITTAAKMKTYLDKWKLNGDLSFTQSEHLTLDNLKVKIGNKKGIYLMIAKNINTFGATGHVTLWIGSDNGYVMGGESKLYLSDAKAIYFWELK